ncbi:MAG: DsbC family protein [Nitrospiraceae bacterium]|nr:DsbC family protein [Nitrospiraceae bacterium]
MKTTIRAVIIALALAVVAKAPSVYGFGGCEEDCVKCHSLSQKEAEQIVSKMKIPDPRVVDIRMSPVRGLWEVSVDTQGRRENMYVGFSKKQVVKGNIIDVDGTDGGAAKTPVPAAVMQTPNDRYVDVSKIPLENALVLGDRNAAVKVVVFTDPECPYCARIHGELKKIVAENRNIAFYLKLFPLKMHRDADWKARSIMCSGSLDLLEKNYEKKPIPMPLCNSSVIDENIRVAAELGVTGTPTFIMPDGYLVLGGNDAGTILNLVSAHQRKDAR